MSNLSNIISLNITEFPQNLLIPGIDNAVKIQVVNNSDKSESFNFAFDGESMEIETAPENLAQQIELAANETRNIDLKLNPTADGQGKLTINVYWLKIVQYTVKIQKIRESSPVSKNNDIFMKFAFKKSEVPDDISVNEYFIDIKPKELRQQEEELEALKERMMAPDQTESTNQETGPKPTIGQIDEKIKAIAKGYLSNNDLPKSLEYAIKLSKPNAQTNLYSNLLRAYSFKSLDEVLSTINNLNDLNLQQAILKSLILDRISEHPLEVINIIEEIKNIKLKTKLLLNVAKELKNTNRLDELVNHLHQIIMFLLEMLKLPTLEKKEKKLALEYLKDVLILLAEFENPTAVDAILKGIEVLDIKDKLEKDIFKVIYEIVDEVKTKIESESVFSQYFLLNTFISNINNELKSFSRKGGNVSNNILSGEFDFNTALLSLFRFDFSIFPFIDRVYNDLKVNSGKSIGYYIFPSNENFNSDELATLNTTLSQFFRKSGSAHNQLLVLNLDFIPYLGKPTIIISEDSHLNNHIETKLKKLGDKINIIIDDMMFKGGTIYDNLTQVFGSDGREVINLVLSYEFLNDYNIFKSVIQSIL
ncbi:MAG: hypothetical protein ACXADU_20445 [Promethearchaeota archaeon]|jgi:hypothetical protein